MKTIRNGLVACTLLTIGGIDTHLAVAEEQQSLEPVTVSGKRLGGDEWSSPEGGGGSSGEASLCKNGGDFDRADACGESGEQFTWNWPWEKLPPCSEVKVDKISASTLKKDGEAIVPMQQIMSWVTTNTTTGKPETAGNTRASNLNTVQNFIREALKEGVPLTKTEVAGNLATFNLEFTEGDSTVFVKVRYDTEKSTVVIPKEGLPKNAIEAAKNSDPKQTAEAKENAMKCSSNSSSTQTA